MKKNLILLLSLMFAVSGTPAIAAVASADEQREIMAAMDAMAKATVAHDVPALNKLFSDEITYGHSAGITQTKNEFMTKYLPTSKISSMTFEKTNIHVYGQVALVKALTVHHHAPDKDGKPAEDSRNDILWVLVKGPSGWQFVARQTTRAPAQ